MSAETFKRTWYLKYSVACPATPDDTRSLHKGMFIKILFCERRLWVGLLCEPNSCVPTARELF